VYKTKFGEMLYVDNKIVCIEKVNCLVIASQAIITGCFSLLSQAGSLGFCPQLYVHHTSETMFGQIYVPVKNL
jgi:K+ transporter